MEFGENLSSMPEGPVITIVTKRYVDSFHQCIAEIAKERMYLSVVEPPDVAVLYEAIEKDVTKKFPLMLAVIGKSVIGWCSVARNHREGFKHSGILSIGVKRGHRGQGLGKRLLWETIGRARAIGISRIELDVFASNTTAIEFYIKQNFEVEGRRRQARLLNGIPDDVICMALLLEF